MKPRIQANLSKNKYKNSCRNQYTGRPKIKYETEAAADDFRGRNHSAEYSTYLCPGCDFYHIGREGKNPGGHPDFHPVRRDDAQMIELGERAAWTLHIENTQWGKDHIMKIADKANGTTTIRRR